MREKSRHWRHMEHRMTNSCRNYGKPLRWIKISLTVSESEALALYFDIPRLQGYVLRLGKEKIAAAAQRFLEECSLDLISCALKRWPRSSLVLSGGCAANVILNMHIFERICENIFI